MSKDSVVREESLLLKLLTHWLAITNLYFELDSGSCGFISARQDECFSALGIAGKVKKKRVILEEAVDPSRVSPIHEADMALSPIMVLLH